jgi:hypothetical protein
MTDWSKMLDTPWFAIGHMAVFSDIREFLDFAESNIEPQKTAALQRIEDEEPEFEDEADAQSYLSFPKIISGRSDDATRTRSVWR